MNEQELIKIQEWRSSIKKFDGAKKIPEQTWAALEKALILSPSSYGLQPWKFLIVTSSEVRKKLTPLSWGQTQVEDCSHYVIFTYRNKMDASYVQNYVNDIATTRSTPVENLEGYKQMMTKFIESLEPATYKAWASKQTYIALGNFMTSAAALGIDTCPMEGLDPVKYDEVLGLTGTEFSTVVACAAGYRHNEDVYSKQKKVRFLSNVVIKHI